LARASRVLERASGELNLAHYRVLSAIASGEERASRVAARLALGKPAVSAAVDSLRLRGLVVRSDVASDHRAAGLFLTAEGQSLLARVEVEMSRAILDLARRTPDSQAVIKSLASLGQAIDEARSDRPVRAPDAQ
jgi:DNA-binding MarR family transcriptional regulator